LLKDSDFRLLSSNSLS